jgi:hypothetical protein
VEWEGGSVRVGELRGAATTAGDGTVGATRAVVPGSARGTALRPGTPAVVDGNAFEGDPRSALGLSFDQLDVRGELGAMPAWFVPPGTGSTGGTWIVFVHGRGGTREESLRYLPGWHRLGLPVLVPTYRNDVGAPAAPDRQDHLGDTEWRDVEAAVRLALDRGARDVVLAGWSMGGAISLQVADRSALRPRIRGLLLDAPVVDWHDVLAAQGRQRGLPSLLTRAAVVTAEQRVDVDLDRFDWVARAGDLRVPVLLHHGLDDDVVPPGPSQALAAARPDLVTLRLVPRAGHTRSWNVDPAGYEAVTSAWLTRLGAAPVPAN